MLFNSLDFAIFLLIVFLLYWFVARKYSKLQNTLIVLVSYVIYGWWDWRFLLLIIFSTTLDYFKDQDYLNKKCAEEFSKILFHNQFMGVRNSNISSIF